MATKHRLTAEAKQKLEEKLHYLKTTRELEVAELLKEARSFGDLSENSEYDEAKNQQEKLYIDIGEIEDILGNCEIIEESVEHLVGWIIKVYDADMEEEMEFEVVSSQESDPMPKDGSMAKISDVSPLCRALVGKAVGDTVKVAAPDGEIEYRVLEMRKK